MVLFFVLCFLDEQIQFFTLDQFWWSHSRQNIKERAVVFRYIICTFILVAQISALFSDLDEGFSNIDNFYQQMALTVMQGKIHSLSCFSMWVIEYRSLNHEDVNVEEVLKNLSSNHKFMKMFIDTIIKGRNQVTRLFELRFCCLLLFFLALQKLCAYMQASDKVMGNSNLWLTHPAASEKKVRKTLFEDCYQNKLYNR